VSHFLTKLWSAPAVQTVAIGVTGVAWITRNSLQTRQLQVMSWSEQLSFTQSIDSIVSRLSLQQLSKVQWVAAPSLVKHWLQQVPDQIQTLSELHAVAVQRAQQLFGSAMNSGSPGNDSSWVVSSNWNASQAFLCAAIPMSWHAAIAEHRGQQSASATLNTLSCITSPLQLIMSSFQKELPASGWLAIVAANTLYLMHFENKTCFHFRSLQLKTALSAEEVQNISLVEWQRDMLRTQKKSDQLHWLCMLPTGVSANAKNALLKPLQWRSSHEVSLMDFSDGDTSPNSTDLSIGLSEVRQAAWCAFQCEENQR
jgi:hypothetical protein